MIMCRIELRITLRTVTLLTSLAFAPGCATDPSSTTSFPARTPFVSYNDEKSAAFAFADIGQSEPLGTCDLRVGFIPVTNPFWTVEDKASLCQLDYSGYAAVLCDKFKEQCGTRKTFPAVIELPEASRSLMNQRRCAEIGSKWGVELIISGVVEDSTGIIAVNYHSSDGTVLLRTNFDNCWNAGDLCKRMIGTAVKDPQIKAYERRLGVRAPRATDVVQPIVETAAIKLNFTFGEVKEGFLTTPVLNPLLLPLAVAAEAHAMASTGPNAEGELVLRLDGKDVVGHLAPSKVGVYMRRYAWTRTIPVRPGKHRLIVDGLRKGHSSDAGRNVYHSDFDVSEGECKLVSLTVDDTKTRWAIDIGSEPSALRNPP